MLDPITHTLCGLALVELGFIGTLGASRARLLAVVASNLSQVDALLWWVAGERFLVDRRALAHGLPFLAASSLALGYLAVRLPRSASPARPASPTVALAALCMATQLLLDVLTPTGAMLWAPFSNQRLALPWLFPVDPLLWALLSLALWGRWLARRPSRAAVGAILLVGLYLGLQGAAWGVTRKRAAAWARLEGVEVDEVAAFPEAPGPLFWNTVAYNDEVALVRAVDLAGSARLGQRVPRGLEEPLVQELLATPPGEDWQAFAAVPVAASAALPQGGYEVWLRDLRFVNRFRTPAETLPFDLVATFNADGELVDHRWQPLPRQAAVRVPLPPIPGITHPRDGGLATPGGQP